MIQSVNNKTIKDLVKLKKQENKKMKKDFF